MTDKKWKPEGWVNPYGEDYESGLQNAAFEVGADAMLEALRKKGHQIYYRDLQGEIRIPVHGEIKGTLVFIPDDEVKHGR